MSFVDLKIIVVGNERTGKSSFASCWANNSVLQDFFYHPTVLVKFFFKIFEYKGKKYRIYIWDLPSKDKDLTFLRLIGKDFHGCIIMSDASDIKTREE